MGYLEKLFWLLKVVVTSFELVRIFCPRKKWRGAHSRRPKRKK
ncbi:hypothetical protein [Brevibacillus massiliensis]|nr:hypothetical protein [Brevibacillus massiliensis]